MNNGRRKTLYILLALAAYTLLLGLLVWVESAREDALIDTLPKALWYSLVTLTTVGYGDLYPVTTVGRVITMVSSIFGVAVIALPAGIITAWYMKEVENEKYNKNNEMEKE